MKFVRNNARSVYQAFCNQKQMTELKLKGDTGSRWSQYYINMKNLYSMMDNDNNSFLAFCKSYENLHTKAILELYNG